jgi:hypothetical protein
MPGCFFKKSPPKASIVIPPAPPPAAPEPLPEPPVIAPSKPSTEVGELPKLPAPASAKPAPARAPRRNPTAGPPPVAAEPEPEEAPAPAPAPLPSLRPILGTRETQQRNQRIQQYLDKARTAIVRVERGSQAGQYRQLIGQVRTFVQQAEEARKTDLVRAENLAERAEVLSRGLPR